MDERQLLEPPRQALLRSGRELERRRARGDHVHTQAASPHPVPLRLEACSPIGSMLDLVDEKDGTIAPPCGLLGSGPQPLPEARQCRLGSVRRGVDGTVTELAFEIEEQGGLADLTGSGEELDPHRRGLGDALAERLAAAGEIQPKLR